MVFVNKENIQFYWEKLKKQGNQHTFDDSRNNEIIQWTCSTV